jgi:predicted RNase H-like HicB family nuclease
LNHSLASFHQIYKIKQLKNYKYVIKLVLVKKLNKKAEVSELKGCHTQSKSVDELIERIKEAIELCLDVYGDEYQKLNLVGVQKNQIGQNFRH